MLRLPQRLIDQLDDFSPRQDGREAAALCYAVIDRRQRFGKRSTVPIQSQITSIHTENFERIGSFTTVEKAKYFLHDGQFILWDQSFSTGRRSQKYQILDRSEISEYRLRIKNSFYIRPRSADDDLPCEFTQRYLDRVECDLNRATEIFTDRLWNHINGRVGRISLEDRKKLEKKRKTGESSPDDYDLSSIPIPLGEIRYQRGRIHRGNLGRRLFSPLTHLDKRLRCCLSYEGKRLIEIDMVSCQPTLIGHLSGDDVLIGDCIGNNFYERITEELNRGRPAELQLAREDAKEFFCAWNFGPNRSEKTKVRLGSVTLEALEVQKVFEKCYGPTATFVWEQKERGYKSFAHNLQKMESKLFVDGVLMELERRGLFGLSIHDSILTTEDYLDEVLYVINQQMGDQDIRGTLKIDGVIANRPREIEEDLLLPESYSDNQIWTPTRQLTYA